MRLTLFILLPALLAACNAAPLPPTSLAAENTSISRQSDQTQRQAVSSAEALIPYAGFMTYPDNWIDITTRRVGP